MTEKEILLRIIKQNGMCQGIGCFDCLFYSSKVRCEIPAGEVLVKGKVILVGKWQLRYDIAVFTYINQYGYDDLVENLL